MTGDELAPPEPTAADRDEDHVTKPTGHVTEPTGHVTGDGPPAMATLDSPFSRARSLTVSGGGRPKIRPRSKPKKSPTSSSGQSHVMSRDSHVTPASDVPPLSDSQVVGSSVAGREEEEEEEGEGEEMAAGRRQRDEQFIMKCQVGRGSSLERSFTSREVYIALSLFEDTYTSALERTHFRIIQLAAAGSRKSRLLSLFAGALH